MNQYIEKLDEKSNSHTSSELDCGCALHVFEFSDPITTRVLVHRCEEHEESMLVGSKMQVYRSDWREPQEKED